MKINYPQEHVTKLYDITAPEAVEVYLDRHRKVLYVNIDGECYLRICRIHTLIISDDWYRERNESVQL